MDLRNAASLLGWDQQTMMPPRGGAPRGPNRWRHSSGSATRCSSPPQTGRLLEQAAAAELERRLAGDSDDASLVRVTRRNWEKARQVPSELAADIARAGVARPGGVGGGARATPTSPRSPRTSTHNLELARRYVDCFDEFDCAYDALLDDYDPG